jgi:hypothetical protein
LAVGKPFINNFLPTLGDMLRLNMSTPATPRTSPDFSSEGLIQAAVLGLTDARFNTNTDIQNIPNMDGFPNGRRLEDDVTRIEMQAVGGLVLNAIGLWTDDYKPGTSPSPVTPQLIAKLTWTAGVEKNDLQIGKDFPFVAAPHRGSIGLQTDTSTIVAYSTMSGVHDIPQTIGVRPGSGLFVGSSYPNPSTGVSNLDFHTSTDGLVTVKVYDARGYEVATLMNQRQASGDYSVSWRPSASTPAGNYFAVLYVNGEKANQLKLSLQR